MCRHAREDRAHTLHSGRRVLLATDGSETSAAAAQALAGRPWPTESEFRVVSVEEPWVIRSSKLDLQEAVTNAKQVLTAAGLKATGAVLSGKAKKVILEEARKWDADLIVVGSHGRRGIKRFLLGSVSEAVVMNAHCSAVVMRGSSQTSRNARATG